MTEEDYNEAKERIGYLELHYSLTEEQEQELYLLDIACEEYENFSMKNN